METKKLLKFLLKDLGELEELVSEKGSPNFDEFEFEFLQSRVTGAKRMIQILYDRENSVQVDFSKPETSSNLKKKPEVQAKIVEEVKIREDVEDKKEKEVEVEEKSDEPQEAENLEVKKEVEVENNDKIETKKEQPDEPEVEEEVIKEVKEDKKTEMATATKSKGEDSKSVELEEEEKDEANQRLGDSFSKEKSVNDLINVDNTKLEHKLSNRPVKSIKSAIGINDRFQYIRELFDGNSDTFSKAVSELDKKNTIQEAVAYLQQNYKWKKNETSLKFVNLVKRRFSDE